MVILKHVLVATDFGEPAATALAYGKDLSRQYNATLHVLHVADDVTQLGSATAPQSELTPSERLSPTFRRGHGGALPRLRYAGSPTPVCEEGDGQ